MRLAENRSERSHLHGRRHAALRGLQRYDLTNAISIGSTFVTAGLTVVVLVLGGGVVAMVAAMVPVTVCSQLVTVLAVRHLDRDFALRWSPASREVASQLVRFGATLSVSQLAVLLQKRSSELIVGSLLSLSAVTPFSLARRLSELPHTLGDQFVKVLLPVASEMDGAGEEGRLRSLYLISTRVTLALVLPIALCVAFMSADLLEVWVGAQYRDASALVVGLVIAAVATTSQWPAGAVFQGKGRFGAFAVAALVSGVVNVGLTLVLVRPYGLTGVVIGTLVPSVLEALGFALPYTLRTLGVRTGELLGSVVLPTAGAALPTVAVLLGARHVVGEPGWLSLAVVVVSSCLVYAVSYLVLPGTRTERQLLTLLILGRRGRRSERGNPDR